MAPKDQNKNISKLRGEDVAMLRISVERKVLSRQSKHRRFSCMYRYLYEIFISLGLNI